MPQQVPLTSPIKGVVRAVPREGQPQDTCWNALNCLPYDRYGRKRLSQRTGLAYQFTNAAAGFIQGMIEAPSIIYPPGTTNGTIGSVTELNGGSFSFTNGTSGPFSYPYPTAGLSILYKWVFNINFSTVATPGDPTSHWQVSEAVGSDTNLDPFCFCWKMNDDPTGYLLLGIGAFSALAYAGGTSQYIISAGLYTGNPTDPSTWTIVPNGVEGYPYYQLFPVNGQTSISGTMDVTITISSAGILTLASEAAVYSATISNPLTQIYFPVLQATTLFVGDDSFSGPNVNATAVNTFSITD